MGRASNITPEAVAEAAAKLVGRGEPVTNKSVLAEIGSGSMSTIVPLLQAWRETQRETEALAEVEVPEVLSTAAERLVAQVWRSAMSEATAGHEALRRELLAARAETDQVRVEMIDLLRGAESERDAARDEAEALSLQIAVVEAALEKSGQTVARVETENARLAERIDARTSEAATARQQAEDAATREADMRSSRDALRDELAGVRKELADVRGQLAAKIERLESAQADLGTARADLVKERAEHAGTREKMKERLERADADLVASRDAEAVMQAARDATVVERDAAMRQASEMADRIREIEAELSRTKEALADAESLAESG